MTEPPTATLGYPIYLSFYMLRVLDDHPPPKLPANTKLSAWLPYHCHTLILTPGPAFKPLSLYTRLAHKGQSFILELNLSIHSEAEGLLVSHTCELKNGRV